jgi:hypothetical protein
MSGRHMCGFGRCWINAELLLCGRVIGSVQPNGLGVHATGEW